MIDPRLHVLNSQPFPGLATALRDRREVIVVRWEEASRKTIPTADEMTLNQLRDHVPIVIDHLRDALASDRPDAVDTLDAAYREHGEKRFRQRFNVDELMAEYEVLRQILIEESTAALGRGLTFDESMALNAGIDRAVRQSVVTFVDHVAHQLKATDDLQSHYISFLNHDLRGGMNGILLMVEVLKRELGVDPKFVETKDDLDSMRRAVLDSVSTMDRFVFAHRLSRGRQIAKFQRFAIKPIINDLVGHLSYSGKESGVQFAVEVDDAVTASSDRELIRLILQNILSNTVKHAKRGGGTVKVAAHQRGEDVVVTISDRGPGIPSEQLPSLFILSLEDPRQGKKAVKLGLPVAKLAADLIGASLRAESNPGDGAKFTLDIPERRG